MNAPETKPQLNVSEVTQLYVAVRDRIKEIEKRHKEELAKHKENRDKLAGLISEFLRANGLEHFATPFGTCYTSTKHSASLADAKAFMDYVVGNQRWDLLDKKANVTAVRAFLKKEDQLPPGVNLSSVASIRVKRGDGAKDDSDDD